MTKRTRRAPAAASIPIRPQAYALAVLGGGLYFLGFVGFGLYPLTWLCFVPVLLAIRGATVRQALLLGTIFGLCTNMGGYYWVIHLLHEFADLNIPLATLGYVLLCIYQGFLLALVIALVKRAEIDLGVAPIWSLAVAFPALELAYPLLFPSYIGNSQYRFSAITQIVEVTGLLGLTVVISLVNGGLFEIADARLAARKPSLRRVGLAIGTFLALLVYGLVRLPAVDARTERARTIKVAIVQTNLGARDKQAKAAEFIRRHQVMSKEAIARHPDLDLIVWPESAYNSWISRATKSVADKVTSEINKPVIFGALTFDDTKNRDFPDAYNTAVLTSSTGDVRAMFDKVELLAFGETIPLADTIPMIKRWFPRGSAFTRGTHFSPLEGGKFTLLPMICYEDIIPAFVRRMWNSGGPAQGLVNITNDSWYGDTHEPLIHLALATFRSIETRRALIRATNTGISAVVDPAGRISQRTGQWTQETLVSAVPLFDGKDSTIYMAIGDAVGWVALLLLAAGLVRSSVLRRRRR